MTHLPRALVFDSGLGGLTVFKEILRRRPNAHYIYVADDAFFPYGAHSEAALTARVVPLMGALIERHLPDLVVIACNTASTLVLPHLRAQFALPFVGTVPAIKPACMASATRQVSVLGTEATVAREYTRALIREFGQGCAVHLVGARHLAALAEAALKGEDVADAAIQAEIAPCFVGDGAARTDQIVLACTHYPLLLERMRALAPWPVTWTDAAEGVARRVAEFLPEAADGFVPSPEFHFTSGAAIGDALRQSLFAFGFSQASVSESASLPGG